MLTFDDSAAKNQELVDEVKAAYAQQGSLERFVRFWTLEKKRKIILSTGYDDDSKHTLVAIGVNQGKEEVFAYLPRQSVMTGRSVKPLQDYIVSVRRDERVEFDVDDAKFGSMIGFELEEFYDDNLCAPLLSFEKALRVCLSYALSDVGEATIQPIDPDFFEEMEFEGNYSPETLYAVHVGYRSPEPIGGTLPGFMSHFYFEARP